ncbi:hypothetical protein NQ317_007998 [Molorchus minor]|uniref:Chitin-binding type-2 domain-containing protein n=1 Tax=Molorchus minor TaxID=1323400 RepID=A0ABQ9J180_9CUCU|nr:hypothetical protein NQ317_007998 [Molorchus minor]
MKRISGTNLVFIALAVLAAYTNADLDEDKWTPSPLCPYPSEDLTRSPYQGDCTKYWECFEGARYVMTCPEGLEYNEKEFRCDAPEIAHCNQYETVTYPTYPHSEEPTEITSPVSPDPLCPYDSLMYYPCPGNCTQYYECWERKLYLMTCPDNLYWSVVHNYCDYLENVDCSANDITLTPPIPTTAGPTTSTGPWTPDPLCPYPSETITYYSYPANCSQFWECFEGNKYLMTCSGDLVWNEEASVCDYKENVNCNRASTTPGKSTTRGPGTTNTGPVTTAPPTSLCANLSDGTLIANPSDCSKFYECVGGIAIDEQCPSDLKWNTAAQTCDFAENVDC